MRHGLFLALDQAATSCTSLLLVVFVARECTVEEFGLVGTAIALCILGNGFLRPWAGELQLVFGGAGHRDVRAPSPRSMASVVAGLGTLVTVAILMVVAFAGGQTSAAPSLVLAATFPLLAIVDAYRMTQIAKKRARRSFIASGTWCATFVVGVLLVYISGQPASPEVITVCWALPGLLISGLVLARHPFAGWRRVADDYRPVLEYSARYTADYLLMVGAAQGALVLVAVAGGLSEAAGLRGAQAVMGPVNVALAAVMTFLLVRQAPGTQSELRFRSACAIGSIVLGVVLLLAYAVHLLPADLGARGLGDSWPATQRMLPPIGVATALTGAALVATTLLRSMNQPRRALRTRLIVSPASLVMLLVVGAVAGAYAAAWGYAVAALAGLVAWYLTLWRATSEARAASRMGAGAK